jgi:hypothetical protein
LPSEGFFFMGVSTMLAWVIVAVLIGALGLWIVLAEPAASPSLTDLTLNVANTTLTWTLDPDGATLRDFEVRIQTSGQADVVRTTTIPRLELPQMLSHGVSYTLTVTARFDDADDVSADYIFTAPSAQHTGGPTLQSLVDITSDALQEVVLAPYTGYVQYQSTIDLPALVEGTTFDIHIHVNGNSVCKFEFRSDEVSISLMSLAASSVSIPALPMAFTVMMKAEVTPDATNVFASINTSTDVLAKALMTTNVPIISSAYGPASGLVNYNVTDWAGLQPIGFRGTSFSTFVHNSAALFTSYLVPDQVPATVSFAISPHTPTTYVMHEMKMYVPALTTIEQTVRLALTFPVLSVGPAFEFVLTAGTWTMHLGGTCESEQTGLIATTEMTRFTLRVHGELTSTADSLIAVSFLQGTQQVATIPWVLPPVGTTLVHAHVDVRAGGYPPDTYLSVSTSPLIAQSTQPNDWPTSTAIPTC